ncbi:hypothetical protein L484_003457 [Morus notabilis]|uniref:Uncharacterized protein n=1 Tax=Morus notabilis TaxID=981085 RepID=W9S218_9ROSA|nr:hypothetical protein L484_003457 [Morus notabilis]
MGSSFEIKIKCGALFQWKTPNHMNSLRIPWTRVKYTLEAFVQTKKNRAFFHLTCRARDTRVRHRRGGIIEEEAKSSARERERERDMAFGD